MTARRVTLILGGARSGKSRHALALAEAHPGRAVFIATAEAHDDEMAARITQHQQERGSRWHTVEAPRDLPGAIHALESDVAVCVVDCLTLWLTNLMMADRDVAGDAAALCGALGECRVPVILVSNEVGLGIVPENALARRFRDEAGRLHQQVAALADQVILVAAGLSLTLKGG